MEAQALAKIGDLVSQYGFPIVSSVMLLYLVWFIWNYITNHIANVLKESNITLIALIDRIRMLDNDIIRLQQKLDTTIILRDAQELRNKAQGKGGKEKVKVDSK